jgi:hypothetical protein
VDGDIQIVYQATSVNDGADGTNHVGRGKSGVIGEVGRILDMGSVGEAVFRTQHEALERAAELPRAD